MTKKEIKNTSNEDLIMELCCMMTDARIYKNSIALAKNICEELKERGIIESTDALFDRWNHKYTM